MGTNYYLHRVPDPCPTCGRQDSSINPSDMDCVAVGGSDVEFREFS